MRLLGTGGAVGIIDILFILFASVGLIVLAPSPVASDILLFPPGVWVLPGVPLRFPGVTGPEPKFKEIALCGSGVRVGVSMSLDDCLLGIITDFDFTILGDFDPSRLPFIALFCSLCEPFDLLLSALDFRPPILGRLLISGSAGS